MQPDKTIPVSNFPPTGIMRAGSLHDRISGDAACDADWVPWTVDSRLTTVESSIFRTTLLTDTRVCKLKQQWTATDRLSDAPSLHIGLWSVTTTKTRADYMTAFSWQHWLNSRLPKLTLNHLLQTVLYAWLSLTDPEWEPVVLFIRELVVHLSHRWTGISWK